MIETRIRRIGNSAVMMLTTEMLAILDAKEGDPLFVVRDDDGSLKIMAHDPSIAAAAYAFGIAKADAFVDGNKRTAFVTALTFLRLNGWAFRPDPVEGVRVMEALADGQVGEARFADWLRAGLSPL